jgi:hypothetical protein
MCRRPVKASPRRHSGRNWLRPSFRQIDPGLANPSWSGEGKLSAALIGPLASSTLELEPDATAPRNSRWLIDFANAPEGEMFSFGRKNTRQVHKQADVVHDAYAAF